MFKKGHDASAVAKWTRRRPGSRSNSRSTPMPKRAPFNLPPPRFYNLVSTSGRSSKTLGLLYGTVTITVSASSQLCLGRSQLMCAHHYVANGVTTELATSDLTPDMLGGSKFQGLEACISYSFAGASRLTSASSTHPCCEKQSLSSAH